MISRSLMNGRVAAVVQLDVETLPHRGPVGRSSSASFECGTGQNYAGGRPGARLGSRALCSPFRRAAWRGFGGRPTWLWPPIVLGITYELLSRLHISGFPDDRPGVLSRCQVIVSE